LVGPRVSNRTSSEGDVKRPQLIQSMLDALQIADLRNRIFFTIGLLVVFRFLTQIPVPGVDAQVLASAFENQALLGVLNLFSGGALQSLSVAALGVYPYITASIIIMVLTPVLPQLKALSQEGESGRQRINQFTHWLTVPIAIFQGWGIIGGILGSNVIPGITFGLNLETMAILVSMVAGTMFLVWLGELITERGLGNGISLIIFAGIVAELPSKIGAGLFERDESAGILLLLFFSVCITYIIVLFTEAQRRIPVQYGRSVFRGGQMQREAGSSFLPLRVNSAGMIPLIFASSIILLPVTVASYFRNPMSDSFFVSIAEFVVNAMDISRYPHIGPIPIPMYWIILFIFVVIFTFFYTMIVFQQQNLADNIQKNGGFVPGIRPGRPTQDYLNRVIIRITWGGAFFLGFVAISPFLLSQMTTFSIQQVGAMTIGSFGLLIMVGVALDTMRQLEAQLMMRNYEGFLK